MKAAVKYNSNEPRLLQYVLKNAAINITKNWRIVHLGADLAVNNAIIAGYNTASQYVASPNLLKIRNGFQTDYTLLFKSQHKIYFNCTYKSKKTSINQNLLTKLSADYIG